MTLRKLAVLGLVGSLSSLLWACGEDSGPGRDPGTVQGSGSGTGSASGSGGTGSTSGGTTGGGSSGTNAGPGTGTGGTTGGGTTGGPTATGSISGTLEQDATWQGVIDLTDHVIIAAGVTITVQPGTLIRVAPEKRLTVSGTLTGSATSDRPILFHGQTALPASWTGLVVSDGGLLDLTGFAIRHAQVGVATAPQAQPTLLTDGLMEEIGQYHLVVGGDTHLDHVILRGAQVAINSGQSSFTDVLAELGTGDDFFLVSGGSTALSYVTVKQHHCPLHANASARVTLDHVDFRGNPYAVMFSDTATASITNSNFDNGQKIGLYSGNGAISAEGNFWGGGSAGLEGADAGQYHSATRDNLADPVEAGARL